MKVTKNISLVLNKNKKKYCSHSIGQTCTHLAVTNDRAEILLLLHSFGVNIDAQVKKKKNQLFFK